MEAVELMPVEVEAIQEPGMAELQEEVEEQTVEEVAEQTVEEVVLMVAQALRWRLQLRI